MSGQCISVFDYELIDYIFNLNVSFNLQRLQAVDFMGLTEILKKRLDVRINVYVAFFLRNHRVLPVC